MHRSKHLLQKLYSREINGTFGRGHKVDHYKPQLLFKTIPHRCMYFLQDVFTHMRHHILIGVSRCGQFLITYSYATEQRRMVTVNYKYRLHWWVFKPGAPAHKVAEVQLFDNQDVNSSLTVGIAQWPNVNDKLIVYGYSDEIDEFEEFEEDEGTESRKYYITVTTLPSLHDCKDCKTVAESFDEEEMAANWDSCIGLSCLKHGLTIHTTLEISPPFPAFDLQTYLKVDNKIIVNTGNFLHVLSFGSDKEKIVPSQNDNIVPAETCHRIGEKLSVRLEDYICAWNKNTLLKQRALTRSVNKTWLNTIMDQAEKAYAFQDAEDGCEPRFKWYRKRRLADKMYEFNDEELENVCPPKCPRQEISQGGLDSTCKCNTSCNCKDCFSNLEEGYRIPEEDYREMQNECRKSLNTLSNLSSEERQILACEPKYLVKDCRLKQLEIFCKRRREQNGNSSCSKGNVLNSKVGCSKDKIILANESMDFQDAVRNKVTEIEVRSNSEQGETVVPSNDSCDQNVSNECDKSSKGHDRLIEESHNKVIPYYSNNLGNTSCNTDCDKLTKNSGNTPESSTSTSNIHVEPTPSKTDHEKQPLNVSIINPDLSAILAEWEADSVSSLSPNSECFLHKGNESKNDVAQSVLELLPGVAKSPRGSNFEARCSLHDDTSSHSPLTTTRVGSPHSPGAGKYSQILVVLRARNCNKDPQQCEEKCKTHCKEEKCAKVKTTKDPATESQAMRQKMISGCSVRFDRIYIEIDEEIISTITDIEDDDQGTGFHCALPLSVHGSAYAQLQMVSSQKAEKMNMHCERVNQNTLDIEQFCFKAADFICKCQGYKFWFVNDYDVEIIDVCPLNGDILGVVCMRVNAEKKPTKNTLYTAVNQRFFYEVRCVFIWNPNTDRCWLEAYSRLIDVIKNVTPRWAPAKEEAAKLRIVLKKISLFSLKPFPRIRSFTHRMWSEDNTLVPSLDEIVDEENLVAFRLLNFPRRARRFF